MRDRLRAMLPWVLASVLVLALAGCAGGGQQQGGGGQGGGEQQQAEMNLDIVEQWAESPHSRVITLAAEREECARCHDGQVFTEFTAEGTREATGGAGQEGGEEATGTGGTGGQDATGGAGAGNDDGQEQSAAADEEAELPPRDWAVSIDCRVCHTGVGVEIAESGQTSIPGEPEAQGGSGALCMTCHNSRHEADQANEEREAPHYSPVADVFLGINAMPTQEQVEESPHADVENTCVGCHLQDENGELSHTFRFENWEGCQREGCHEQDPRQATEDYDGDGQEEEFQAEIDGLLEAARTNIEQRAGGPFRSERGAIVFEGGRAVDNDVYADAYNYLLVWNDGSRGLHNPEFTVNVLRDITGGEGGGAGGGSQDATGGAGGGSQDATGGGTQGGGGSTETTP